MCRLARMGMHKMIPGYAMAVSSQGALANPGWETGVEGTAQTDRQTDRQTESAQTHFST